MSWKSIYNHYRNSEDFGKKSIVRKLWISSGNIMSHTKNKILSCLKPVKNSHQKYDGILVNETQNKHNEAGDGPKI